MYLKLSSSQLMLKMMKHTHTHTYTHTHTHTLTHTKTYIVYYSNKRCGFESLYNCFHGAYFFMASLTTTYVRTSWATGKRTPTHFTIPVSPPLFHFRTSAQNHQNLYVHQLLKTQPFNTCHFFFTNFFITVQYWTSFITDTTRSIPLVSWLKKWPYFRDCLCTFLPILYVHVQCSWDNRQHLS